MIVKFMIIWNHILKIGSGGIYGCIPAAILLFEKFLHINMNHLTLVIGPYKNVHMDTGITRFSFFAHDC